MHPVIDVQLWLECSELKVLTSTTSTQGGFKRAAEQIFLLVSKSGAVRNPTQKDWGHFEPIIQSPLWIIQYELLMIPNFLDMTETSTSYPAGGL